LDGFGPSPSKPGKNCCPPWISVLLLGCCPTCWFPFLLWTENNGSVYPPFVAFESSSLRITFNFSKQPGNPQTTLVQATFTNLTPNVFTDFIFQAAVPKVDSDVVQSAFFFFFSNMLSYNIFFFGPHAFMIFLLFFCCPFTVSSTAPRPS
jgi:hypothetical protein